MRNLASIIHHPWQLTAPRHSTHGSIIHKYLKIFLCEKVLNMQIGALQKNRLEDQFARFLCFFSEKISWAICSFHFSNKNSICLTILNMFVWNSWHYQIAEFNISDPFLGSVPISFHILVPSLFHCCASCCDLNLANTAQVCSASSNFRMDR